MKLTGKTDVGNMRTENQDCFCAGQFSDNEGFALVCDGMGGANGGATASGVACDVMGKWLLEAPERCKQGDEKAFLLQATEHANRTIFTLASQEEQYAGMGTTAVGALVRDGQAYICHVGDSRCYLLRGQSITQLTKDHSYVQGLVDCGTITEQEALEHPKRNAITRALGVEHRVEPDYTCLTLVQDDLLLLCSDGLSNMLSSEEIQEICTKTSFEQVPETLVEQANMAGGYDNITAVVMKMEPLEVQNG